jgi:hypothetical protein
MPQNASAPVDWTAVHGQLNDLGATCIHLERLAQGGCRMTCLLATADQGRTHHIDVRAGSEADAVRLALAQAQEYAGRK